MAYLMLADGTCFQGVSVGAETYAVGELVFNTSHLGYQEILTDPSYFGQIINFTSPHIGNVGVNPLDFESKTIHALGAIFRSYSHQFHHWQATASLGDLLKQHNVVALSGIDTRALTLHLREYGNQGCCIVATNEISSEKALEFATQKQVNILANEAALVSTKIAYCYTEPTNYKKHVVIIDCGVKAGILEMVAKYSVKITVVPQSIPLEELHQLKPDGVVLSNGPGDPNACDSLIQLTASLLTEKLPIFGICLGHQILALAGGGSITKMKFGHHGANHPIKCLQSGAVFISSQNHNFVVEKSTLPDCFKMTHVSLFDETIAGLEHRHAPAFSFQGHPEANPGPKELGSLFTKFIERVNHA